MKKTATGLTLAAALSLTAFAAAPASALNRDGTFQNCAEVYASGIYNITPDHPQYDEGLDRDSDPDLIGCENPDFSKYPNVKAYAPAAAKPSAPKSELPDHVTLPDSVDNQFTYPDCKDVFAAGLANLPKSSEYYHEDLDADLDGVGCEYNVEYGIVIEGREEAAKAEIAQLVAAKSEASEKPQVTVVPEGTPNTGAEGAPVAPFAVGALALAAVAGAGVAARRRQA